MESVSTKRCITIFNDDKGAEPCGVLRNFFVLTGRVQQEIIEVIGVFK